MVELRPLTIAVLFMLASSVRAGDTPCRDSAPDIETKLPLIFCDDFSKGAGNWEPADPKAWRLVDVDGNKVYEQFGRSKIENPVRSPFNRNIQKDVIVGSFVLDVKFQSTKEDYPHRDLCLFFGFNDPSHFYYVHFGKRTDDHANQIFIVNEKPRTKISTKTTAGTNWDDEWHHARIVRDVDSGTIEVFFDDMKEPIMTATDKTFRAGRIGIGSFDDTGRFDDIYLFGDRVEPGQKVKAASR